MCARSGRVHAAAHLSLLRSRRAAACGAAHAAHAQSECSLPDSAHRSEW